MNVASYLLIDRAPNATKPSETCISTAISLLTFTVVVFRTEVVLLLAPLVLQSLVSRHITLSNVLKAGVLSGFASLGAYYTLSINSSASCRVGHSPHSHSGFLFLG